MSSTLKKYYRKPKLFINLPSKGLLYENNESSMLDEVGIMPMTMLNQLMVNNPETLINGAVIEELIRDCTNITTIEPRNLLKCDVDAICAAIRKVSNDSDLELSIKCPSCGEKHTYGINLDTIVGNMAQHSELPSKFKIYDDEVTLHIVPYTLKDSMRIDDIFFKDIKEIERLSKEAEKRMSDSSMEGDEDKITEDMSSFVKDIFDIQVSMTKSTLSIYANSIHSISTPDGEETDKEEIENFLAQLDDVTFNEFKEEMSRLNSIGIQKSYPITCGTCEHEFEAPIELNHSDFFGNGS